MKLVLTALILAAVLRQRTHVTQPEQRQILPLRWELGLDAAPPMLGEEN